MNLHVIPVDDVQLHRSNKKCNCMPLFEQLDDHELYLHHAWDLREIEERKEIWTGKEWMVIGE